MRKLEFDLPIYTYQIDFAGHVSNIVYVQWMEIGRLRLLEAVALPVEELLSDGISPILASTEIDYRSPLFLGDRVRAEVWLSELRHASVRIEFRFYNQKGELAASGSQKGLFAVLATMYPYRMPRQWRDRMTPFLAPTAAD